MNDLLSLLELVLDLKDCGHLALHPWVTNYLSDTQTMVRVELKHGCDQVLKLLCIVVWFLAFLMYPPEISVVIGAKELIVQIIEVGVFGEGLMA